MTRNERLESLKQLKAYEVKEVRDIPDLDSTGVILSHRKTGARVVTLINDDDNKVFCIGFRTPPTDSTGVAHIIEHSVLCGSAKYPVKDPFIELAKGSLNTFLNAMTFPDKTVYPVASCNDKDFENLCDVYMDAVFNPNIYHEEKIFMQEGWHYELESADSELKINGVVYNEMKGAFSSPDDVVDRNIMNSLFPDTAYGVESGGDPDDIPNLTYKDFLDFHSRYYHPSNSYIYLYGDCDMAARLEAFDIEYLSKYDRLDIDSAVKLQSRFDKMRVIEKEYPVAETASGEGQTYLTYNVVISDDNLDPEEYIAFEVLDYALASTPGSPVKKALIDAGIGRDVYSVDNNGTMQPFFSIIAKDTDPDRREEFVRIIESVLKDLSTGALDHTTLYAAINLFEFKYREADFGSYPKGLMIGLKSFDSWLYDDMQPFIHVISNDVYTNLRARVEQGYFERLIDEKLLNNTHKVILSVVPKPGLTGVKDRELAEKLAGYKASLSDAEIDTIVSRTAELAAYQESEDSPEALAKIPMLTRQDLRRSAEHPIFERMDIADTETIFHDIFTNGIGYLRFLFKTDQVPADYWPYVGLIRSVMGVMDTAKYSYSDLYTTISLNTGGISPTVNSYNDAKDPESFKVMFEVEAKALFDKLEMAIDLMKQMICTSVYGDRTRLKEVLDETLSGVRATMTSSGNVVAVGVTGSEFSVKGATVNAINGIPFLRLLEDALDHYDEMFDDLVQKMNETAAFIFRPENLIVDYTGTKESLTGLGDTIAAFKESLFTDEKNLGKGSFVQPEPVTRGYTTAAQIQYVSRGGSFTGAGLKYSGAFHALKVIMGYDYLWNQVRVRGGAYGCMCSFARNGHSAFVSYRDPHLERTVGVFEGAADYVRNFSADERTMTQHIIGAVADLDMPRTPRGKGIFGMSVYLSGLSYETLQRERDELLDATVEDIRALADHIDAVMDTGAYCVVGCEEKVRAASDGFDHIEPLFRD